MSDTLTSVILPGARGELGQIVAESLDVSFTHSRVRAGGDKLAGDLDGGPDGDEVGPVGGVETDGIGDGDLPGGPAGTGPFVHRRGKADPELGGDIFAVAEELEIASGGLVSGLEAVRQPDRDLLSDDAGFLHAGEVTAFALAALLPVEGEHRVAVAAVDRVDLHPGRAGADFDNAVPAFALSGHRTRFPCQLFWNLARPRDSRPGPDPLYTM